MEKVAPRVEGSRLSPSLIIAHTYTRFIAPGLLHNGFIVLLSGRRVNMAIKLLYGGVGARRYLHAALANSFDALISRGKGEYISSTHGEI